MIVETRFEGHGEWTAAEVKSHTDAVREFIQGKTLRGKRIQTRNRGESRTYTFAVRVVTYVDVLLLGSDDGFGNDTFFDEAPITPINITIDPADAL